LTLAEAQQYAASYIESGSSLPQIGTALPGSTLIKVVPTGEVPSDNTGYWMSIKQARAIATMSPEQAGQVLGLPADKSALIQSQGMSFYAITTKSGQTADVFVSNVASTSQGSFATSGGAQQVIVSNRSQWTDPTAINPFDFH
jgi:filamentous hemagglutinin